MTVARASVISRAYALAWPMADYWRAYGKFPREQWLAAADAVDSMMPEFAASVDDDRLRGLICAMHTDLFPAAPDAPLVVAWDGAESKVLYVNPDSDPAFACVPYGLNPAQAIGLPKSHIPEFKKPKLPYGVIGKHSHAEDKQLARERRAERTFSPDLSGILAYLETRFPVSP